MQLKELHNIMINLYGELKSDTHILYPKRKAGL